MEISENKKVKWNKYIVGSNIVFAKALENVKFILSEQKISAEIRGILH